MNDRKPNREGNLEKQVVRLMKTAMQLPRYWLIVASVFVFLSMFDVVRVAEGGLSFAFRVTNTTAIFLALIWLPALLQLYALAVCRRGTCNGSFTDKTSPVFVCDAT